VAAYERRPALALFLLFVIVSLLTRGFLLGVDILDVDEAMHIVGSWEMIRGSGLYVGFVDNKPPLLYVYYAIAQMVFGHGMFAVHLVTVLFTVPLIGLGVSAFFRHDRRGIIAGLTFLVFSAAYLAHDMHAANCELLMLLPATWAVVALRDEERGGNPLWQGTAGALLGVAVLFKQQALAWLPALMLAAMMGSRTARRSLLGSLAALVGGVVMPLLATWGVFAARGRGGELLNWTLLYNFRYAQQPMEPGEALMRVSVYFVPFVAATFGLWMLAARSWSLLSRYHRAVLAALALCTGPIVFIGFRMYPHYFVPLYTPLALAAAPQLAALLRRPLGRPVKLFLGYALASLLGFSIANGVIYLSGREFPWEEHSKLYDRVAARLKSDRCRPGASLFSWGPEALFLYRADVAAASRFIGPHPTICGLIPGNWAVRSGQMRATDVIRRDHWDQLLGDLERSRATYFLDASEAFRNWNAFPLGDFPRMRDFVRAHYEPLGTIDGVRIFRWRGCQASVTARDGRRAGTGQSTTRPEPLSAHVAREPSP
jgi:hypothetical protein